MFAWVKANAKREKIKAILSHKLDRVCRNMRDAVRLQDLEDSCGVQLAFVDNQFGPGAAGALSFNVMAAVAQYYSDNLRSEVLKGMEIEGVTLVGVAKGADRRPGQERLFLPGHELPTILPPDSPALHLIQRVRDEAHRFAITGHRARRAKARTQSVLETVPGLGPRKRRELLRQFGGLQGVSRAGVDDLAKVHGISRKLAQSIYDTLHANG